MCKEIQRAFLKRRLASIRRFKDICAQQKAKAQANALLMALPFYKNRMKTIDFLKSSPRMLRFVDLAVAHYNVQIDRSNNHSPERYVKNDLDSMLDIAEDYFTRDRSGLVEWWCRFNEDGQKFLNDIDRVKLDLLIPFHDVFKDKCVEEFGIDVNPDDIVHRQYISWPCLDVHGNPNVELMEAVELRAKMQRGYKALAFFV